MRIALATVSGSRNLAGDQRRSPLGLEAEHSGGGFGEAGLAPLLEASPVGGNVAGVADGQGEGIRRAAQRLADLEGSRLLALDAVGVYGVDEGDVAKLVGGPLGELQCRVEVSLDLDYLRAVGETWTALPSAILPAGTTTKQLIPARAE
jgi:hypothetical protein